LQHIMKKYTLKFSVVLIEGDADTYSPTKALSFDIKENLPANVDAQLYIKRRLAEEVKRNFDAMLTPVDNKTEEVIAAEDPLADPF
jgi:hypothetical protein